MAKQNFILAINENVNTTTSKGFVMDDNHLFWGLFQNSFPVGTVMCLLPGDMYTGEYNHITYIQHRVLVWLPGSTDPEVTMLAKSKHIFSHLGMAKDGEAAPVIKTKAAKKGIGKAPDAEWIQETSPFRFKILSRIDGEQTFYNASVEKPQWVRVEEIRRYWVPKYAQDGLMVVKGPDEDPITDLKKVSKPLFMAHTPSEDEVDYLNYVLDELKKKDQEERVQ